MNEAPYQSVYIVRAGDSLAKIAEAFYGDSRKYVFIAEANGLNPNLALPAGTKINIPPPEAIAGQQPRLNGAADMELPRPEIGPENVLVTASRLPSTEIYEDWRLWAGGVALLLLYLYMKDGR